LNLKCVPETSLFLEFKFKTLKFCPVPPAKSMAVVPARLAVNEEPTIFDWVGAVIALTDALLLKFQ
jgi:hypothetical protein